MYNYRLGSTELTEQGKVVCLDSQQVDCNGARTHKLCANDEKIHLQPFSTDFCLSIQKKRETIKQFVLKKKLSMILCDSHDFLIIVSCLLM